MRRHLENSATRSSGSTRTAWLDAGLQHRTKHEEERISFQYEELNWLFAAVYSALNRSAVHIAREAFTRFADALEAHFALEDELYFPALQGLRTDLGPALETLVDEHCELRGRLAELRALFSVGEAVTSRERLGELAALLADHEDRTEALIAKMNQGISAASAQRRR